MGSGSGKCKRSETASFSWLNPWIEPQIIRVAKLPKEKTQSLFRRRQRNKLFWQAGEPQEDGPSSGDPMSFTLLVSAGIAIVALYWCFLIVPVILAVWRHKPLPKIHSAVLQMNLVLLIAEAALVSSQIGTGLFLFPFIAIPWYLNIISKYWLLFETPVIAGIVAASTLLVVLAMLFRQRAWYFAPALATATLCAITLIAAMRTSTNAQAAGIASLQPDCSFPGDFLRSLRIAGLEFQFDYHMLALKQGTAYGWSFSSMDFYRIPENAIKNLNRSELAFQQCYGRSPA
jgi:hypothetical protein